VKAVFARLSAGAKAIEDGVRRLIWSEWVCVCVVCVCVRVRVCACE
jgi:hypothetical protein